MKQILYGGILLAVLLSACSPQQASPSSMTGSIGTDFTLNDTLEAKHRYRILMANQYCSIFTWQWVDHHV